MEVVMADESRLGELDRVHFLTLLSTRRIGRLVLTGETTYVAPVNYVVVQEALHFRTDAGSRASQARGAVAVFEVDAVDEIDHAGWSVVVRGTVEDVTNRASADQELVDLLEPWAPGPKDRWMRISIDEVTGRWIRGELRPWAPDERGYL